MFSSLVTGGAGAIGSNLVLRLLKEGHRVDIIDDLSSGFKENIPEEANFIHADISDPEVLEWQFSNNDYDYIFHLAALFANQNSVEHPLRDLHVNGEATLRIAQYAAKMAIEGKLKRILYASSSCVYGSFSGMANEETKFNPETPYAMTKLIGEQYLSFYNYQEKLPLTVFRYFNSYGPGERPGKYRNVIPNFIDRALKNQPLIITGTGDETRDFTFIADVIDCMLLAMKSDKANGEVYNIASGRETKIRDLAEMIIELSGSRSEVEYVSRRSWDRVLTRCGDISKARRHLMYNPNTALKDGLKQVIKWIRALSDSLSLEVS